MKYFSHLRIYLSIIRDFITRYPLSANSLNELYEKTKESEWAKFADVKQTWNSCDAIGNDRYVFDIGGNDYRLIAVIHFKISTLYIRKILIHAAYTAMSKRGGLDTL